MTTYPQPSDPVSALTRADGTSEAHSEDHGRVIEQWENVKHHGAKGDSATDDSTAIQAAITAAGIGVVYFPPGTYVMATGVTFGTRCIIRGAGHDATRISYTGSGKAFSQSSAGSRIYNVGFEGFTLTGTASGTHGIDLDSVTDGHIRDVTVSGFSTGIGIRIYSPTGGYSVGNQLDNVIITSCATGLDITGTASNAQRYFGGKVSSCTTGIDLDYANDCTFVGLDMESNTTAVKLSDPALGATNGNRLIACRFESNTTDVLVDTATTRYTQIISPYTTAGVVLTDNGFGTCIVGDFLQVFQGDSPKTTAAPYILERTATVTSVPAVRVVDTATGSTTPIALQIEQESTGTFVAMKKGGTTYFNVNTAGDVEIDGALNHDGTTVGFYGVTPATRPTAYTQTYSTADKTHASPTAATLTVTDGAGTNDNTIGAITADASVIAAVQELADEINKLVADVADVKQIVNSVIDDLQTLGLLQ